MTDAEWLERYALIRSEGGAIVPLRLRRVQRRYLKLREEIRRRKATPFIVVLKGRQVGVSSVVGLANMMDAIRNPGAKVTIVANKSDVCKYIARRYMYEPLAAMLTSKNCTIGKDYGIKLKNFIAGNSESCFVIDRENGPASEVGLVSAFIGKQSGRSITTQILHLSEVAYWQEGSDGQRALEAIRALMFSMPDYETCPFGSITVESTAWGRSGLFAELWHKATQNAMGMTALFSPWYECDSHILRRYERPMPDNEDDLADCFAKQLGVPVESKDVENWTEYALKMRAVVPPDILDGAFWYLVRYGLRKCHGILNVWRREAPLTPDEAFILTNDTFFSQASIEKISLGLMTSPRFYDVLSPDTPPYVCERIGEPASDVVFAVYHKPAPGERFVIGVDCALGSSYNDYSTTKSNTKSATVISVWRTDGEQAAEWWAVGLDGPTILNAVVAIAKFYNNAIVNPERNSIGKWLTEELLMTQEVSLFWTRNVGRNGLVALTAGSIVSAATRDEIISRFRWCVDSGTIKIRSVALHKEIQEFIMKDGLRPEGIYRDDRIWAAAHAATVLMSDAGMSQAAQVPQVEYSTPVETTYDNISDWVRRRIADRL